MITYAEAIREALRLEMRRNPSTLLLGENVSSQRNPATRGLAEEFGRERVRDTPISEAGFLGAALGAAILGLRPIVEVMNIDFALVAMDQLLNQLAKTRYLSGGRLSAPVTVRAIYGGGRSLGATPSEALYSLFAHMPGLRVVAPSNPYDAKGLLTACVRGEDPALFLEHRLLYDVEGPVPPEAYTIPLGVANVLREGDDVTVVAVGLMVRRALEAADELRGEVSVESWTSGPSSPSTRRRSSDR